MALPTSGNISLNDIKAEFGGNASPKLTDYLAGGSFVPAGTSGTNGAVPSSPPIAITDFYGTSAENIVLTNHSPAGGFGLTYGSAELIARANGELYFETRDEGGVAQSGVYAGEWATTAPNTNGADYEVRITVTNGATPAGSAVGTWLQLNVDRNWILTCACNSSVCNQSSDFTMEIRRVGTTTVLASATMTLNTGCNDL